MMVVQIMLFINKSLDREIRIIQANDEFLEKKQLTSSYI